jgi:hypothetical protein
MIERRQPEPSDGWFMFLAFAVIGFAGSYVSGQVLVMLGTILLGALIVAAIYYRDL